VLVVVVLVVTELPFQHQALTLAQNQFEPLHKA
jgi:hypothetical protein